MQYTYRKQNNMTETIPHIYIENVFNESDLVSFGNYLLGTYRIESYQETETEIPLEERLASVHQEDIDNWKTSFNISTTVEAYIKSDEVITKNISDFTAEDVIKRGITELSKVKLGYQKEIEYLLNNLEGGPEQFGQVGIEIFTQEFKKEMVKYYVARIYNIDLELNRKYDTLIKLN